MSNDKSKRYKGVAFFVTGFATCIVSFIIGSKVVPEKVLSKVKEKICVSSSANPFYRKWVGSLDEFGSSAFVKVTYWNITNKNGFLYRGEKPVVKEVGPYIYRISSAKANVSFSSADSTVKYKSLKSSQFDLVATRAACPKCSESDKITIPNVGYIGLTLAANGDKNLAIGFLGAAYLVLLGTVESVLKITRSKAHEYLGTFDNTSPLQQASKLPTNWSPVGFAPWFALQSQNKLSPLYGLKPNASRAGYNGTEMQAIATVITSPVLLGTTGNRTLLGLCLGNPNRTGCGFLFYMNAIQTLEGKGLPSNNTLILAVRRRIQDLFCQQLSVCLVLDRFTSTALVLYITEHLAKLAIHVATDRFDFGPLMTRTVKQISHGFVEKDLKIPNVYPNGFPVKSFLPLNKLADASTMPYSTFYMCSHASKAFQIKAFNDSYYISSKYYPKATVDIRRIEGHTSLFGIRAIRPCTTKQNTMKDTYTVFDSMLKLKYDIVRKGTENVGPIYTHKFEVDSKTLYKKDNMTVFTDGLIDTSESYRGVPVVTSMPHFVHGDPELVKTFNTKPDESLYKSTYSVEPVSGIPFKMKTFSQINIAIPEITIKAPRQPPLNISYVETRTQSPYKKVIPLLWMEIAYTASEQTQSSFSGVYTGIDASCACMIIGPLLGGAGLLLGLVYVVQSFKNQVRSHVDLD